MAARKKKRTVKRGRSVSVKAKLGGVIKSLQDIKKHVGAAAPVKRGKRGPAKTKRDILPPMSSIEPMTLDSPTIRRPIPASRTLRSAGETIRMF